MRQEEGEFKLSPNAALQDQIFKSWRVRLWIWSRDCRCHVKLLSVEETTEIAKERQAGVAMDQSLPRNCLHCPHAELADQVTVLMQEDAALRGLWRGCCW